MIIIGITGTLGAGKGVAVSYLEKKGFVHYSARSFILEEVRKRGLPEVRDSNVTVANELRKIHSPSYILESLYNMAAEAGGNSVLESVRTPGEIDFLKKQKSFYLLSVNADQNERYRRVVKRNTSFDNVSFDEFQLHDSREMEATDPNKQNIGECMRLADFQVQNDGTIEEFHVKIDAVLKEIEKREKSSMPK